MTNAVAGSPQSSLNPDRIVSQQSRAEAKKAKAGRSMTAFGKRMAQDFLKAVKGGSKTWQQDILTLLTTANDKQQAEAMGAASKVAEAEQDETAAQTLKKRISEARRVFKAAKDAYEATLAIWKGDGSIHDKLSKLPKQGNAGRPKGTGAGKTKEEQEQEKAKETKQRISKQDIGAIIEAIRKLSFGDTRIVLDVCLFHLSNSNNKAEGAAARASMKAFDEADKATPRAAKPTEQKEKLEALAKAA